MFTFLLAVVVAFPMVENGQPKAVIAPPASDAPVEIRRAISELQRVVEKMTGAKLEARDDANAATIHVGRSAFVEKAGLNLDTLDEDGFVIQTVGPRNLVLAGRRPHGTEFAVYRFLQKYGGVRWYFPTELGEVMPRRASFGVGKLADREEPSFHSRLWSSAARFDGGAWERHNLCRGRYNFHHNLLRIFVPSKLYEKHPEWFPEINGQRKRPRDDQDHSWQPCFSNLEVARYAAEAARRYFQAHPDAVSFSLGMNDTSAAGFCQCAQCRALDPTDPREQKTPRGLPNYSNRFFTFMNRVAAELAKTHPDKYLGCLAYNVTEPPPTFEVHPRIIPYLTGGRANWTDPVIREGDQKLIRAWSKTLPIVGIYDYYYGGGFVIPRLFTQLSEESLKFAHQAGVRAFYAEIYSAWSLDGPKAWVASQLLWNVHQSASKLVDEFCRDLFGTAAEPMREYFRFCEQTWMSRPPGSTVMWAGLRDARQLELWAPSTCARARTLLDKAIQAAASDNDLVQKRVRLYSDGFRQTELWSAVYHGEKSAKSLADVQRALDAQLALEKLNHEVIKPNVLHSSPIVFEERARNLPGGSLLGALIRLADQPGADAALRQMAGQKTNPEAAATARAVLALREHPESVVEVLKNPSFERDGKSTPACWSAWFRSNTPGKVYWTERAARTGKFGAELVGTEASCVMQTVPVKPGESYLASVFVRAPPGGVSDKAEVRLHLQWKDADGKWLSGVARRGERLPAGEGKDWTRLCAFVKAPPNAACLVFSVNAYHQATDEVLQMDDASLRRLPKCD